MTSESLVGQVVGGYRLQDAVASDESGQLYRAHDPARGHATVKVLREKLDAAAADRVLRAAASTAAIDDPHLVTIRAVVDAPDKRTALVMEDLDARTLADEITVGGLETERIVHIGEQITDAMIALHAAGMVHGGLSASNVLLQVKGDDTNWVQVPAVAGPQSGTDLDPRRDVEGLGRLLYLMLAGIPPEGEVPPAPSDFVGGERSPPWLDRLVLEMLATDPSHRPATMGLVKQRLGQGRGLVVAEAVASAWADSPLTPSPAGESAPMLTAEAPPLMTPPSTPPTPAETSVEAPETRVAVPIVDPPSAPARRADPARFRVPTSPPVNLRAATPAPVPAVDDDEDFRIKRGFPLKWMAAAVLLAAAGAGLYLYGGGIGGNAQTTAAEPPPPPPAPPDAQVATLPVLPPDAALALTPDLDGALAQAAPQDGGAAPDGVAALAASPVPDAAPISAAVVKATPPDAAPARRPAAATRPPPRPAPTRPPPRRPVPAVVTPTAAKSPGAELLKQGHVHRAAGRLDQAEQAYFRASTSGDKHAMADATLGLADIALRRRRFSDAATKARRALSLGAERRAAWDIVGQAKCALGDRAAAEAAYAEAAAAGGPRRQCLEGP